MSNATNLVTIPPAPQAVTAAAQSPDPTLRALAARRLELSVELTKIDSFFDTLQMLGSGQGNSTLAEINARIEAGSLPKPQFVAAVRDILISVGHPLQPAALFQRYHALYPAFAGGGADALRKRLHGMKDTFIRTKHAGYWPADVPLPEGLLE